MTGDTRAPAIPSLSNRRFALVSRPIHQPEPLSLPDFVFLCFFEWIRCNPLFYFFIGCFTSALVLTIDIQTGFRRGVGSERLFFLKKRSSQHRVWRLTILTNN